MLSPSDLATARAMLQRQIRKAAFVLSLHDRFPDAASPRDALERIGMSPESVNLMFSADTEAT